MLGCGSRKDLAAAFRTANPRTSFEIERAHKWLQGRAAPRDLVLMGFGLDDDPVHSPNEKFDLRCFHGGARSHARLLARIAAGG